MWGLGDYRDLGDFSIFSPPGEADVEGIYPLSHVPTWTVYISVTLLLIGL